MKKLLLAGTDSVHTYNYLRLVKDHFDEVMLIVQEGGTTEVEGVKMVKVNFSLKNPLASSATRKTIRRIIDEFRPSVIHIHQAGATSYHVLKAAGGTKVPCIVTAWGGDVLLLPHSGWLYKMMVQYVLGHAAYYTSDSLYMAGEMQKLMPGRMLDITIANFGINIEVQQVPKENIIYSNRLHKPLYRIDKVIQAFAKFRKTSATERWKLVIAATGTETDNLKALVAALGIGDDVEFAGWVTPQVNASYYNRAKIFVSVPESDATAISLLEAMAAGCIPVLSNLPANMEWVLDGVNGLIVPNVDESFFDRVTGIDEQRAIEMNRDIIAKKGTREANRKKFITLYERAINDNKL
jgi:glycosyltransferase involved in cell wall biosynthesis